MTTHSLSGYIFERGTPRGVPNLRIEAWDSDLIVSDVIAVATTDAAGSFTITLDSEYLRSHFGDRSPILALRVFRTLRIGLDGGGYATTYTNLVTHNFLWKLPVGNTVVRLEVDLAAGAGREILTPSIVRGVVRTSAGAPSVGVAVNAYDQNLSGEDLLGSTVTDTAGRYQITYTELARAGKVRPDLVVRAVGHEEVVLAESERICQAPATVIVNLSVGGEYRGPSEYDALSSRLSPLTAGFDLAEATEEHIERLSCGSETETTRIKSLAAASSLSAATGLAAPVLYGLLRRGIPAARKELLTTRPAELRQALEGALADNLVPATLTATLEATMTALRQATIALAFEAPPETATGSLGALLATVLPTRAIQEELLDVYLTHTGTLEEFWGSLGERASFEEEGTVAKLQLAFQLGALTRQHFPLLTALQARLATESSTSLRDLAGLSEADWVALIEATDERGSPIGYPADIPGASVAEKKASYARVLKSTMEAAFPTIALQHDLERSLPPGGLSLNHFFEENPSFEFGKARVGDYLAKNESALSHYGDLEKTSVVVRLKALERLYRVTPRFSEMNLFLGDGHDSARSMVRMGKDAFTARYGAALGGTEAADALFNRAESAADHAQGLYALYSPALNPTLGYGLPSYVPSSGDQPSPIADYKTLFGSADGCECEHCSSVYGAAAYLVDLLQFLGKYPSKLAKHEHHEELGFWSAREILIGSPPGEGQPTKLRRPDIGWIALSCDNTDTPLPYVDLVNEILEHWVAAAPAPYGLLIATEGTAEDLAALPQILAQESVQRAAAYTTLATAAYPFEAPFHLWAEEARVYLQHLGVPRGTLMETLRKELTGAGAAEQRALIAAERVGLTPYERKVITAAAITSPTTVELYAFWGVENSFDLNSLHAVPKLLQRSGLEYDDLLEIVDCAYLKEFAPLLSPVSGGSACQPDQMQLVWDTDDVPRAWSALHRFLRLQRRLGWSFRELDQVVMASGGNINDACLEVIAVVLRLRDAWGVPIPVLASWFGNIDTQRRDGGATPSFYEQVFQNKAVTGGDDLALGTVMGTLSQHADAIRGALSIDAADFARLTDAVVLHADIGTPAGSPVAGPTINIVSLSKLHRIVTFARAAGLSIRDFLLLGHLSGILEPTTSSTGGFNPAEVESFLEMVATVQRSRLAPVDVAYLLCSRELPGATVVPDDKAISAMLDVLYVGLLKIADETEDPIASLDAQQRLIRQTLSASLKLDLPTTMVLLDELLTEEGLPESKLINAFDLPSPPLLPPATRSEDMDVIQGRAYRHLAAAAKLIGRLDLTTAEVSTLGASLFDFDATPWDPSAVGVVARFASFLTLVELRALRSTLTGADQGLLAIFSGAEMDKTALVSRATGWPAADIAALLAGFDLTLGVQGEVVTPARALLRLRDAFVALKRLGVPAAKALGWIDTSAPLSAPAGTLTASDIATSVIHAAKSKYGADGWAEVAPPIRDVLREKQRKVLVAYLVAKHEYVDSDALFARLLVDVETSPAQLTSRIKQALGSVQTFVQRSLLNLEEDVSLPAEAAHQWEWMKSYRVWEANRKIFLYPENWIVPELRDDKTPFFTAMESELRQKDMTTEVAEVAFGHYLDRLGDVARLEVVAMVHEEEEAEGLHAAIDVLHVIGRTVTVPHKHYYRTHVDAQWTAWEAVDLEIESDHLLLQVMNRRLRLFWALITEEPDPSKEQPRSDPGQSVQTHLEVRLAWSEYRSKKWTARKMNVGDPLKIGKKPLTFLPEPQSLSLIPAWYDPIPGPVITLWYNAAYPQAVSQSQMYWGRFSLDECGDKFEAIPAELDSMLIQNDSDLLMMPYGARFEAQNAVQVTGSKLNLPFANEGDLGHYVVLGQTPSPFRVLTQQHLKWNIDSTYNYSDREMKQLFYTDRAKTFFAEIETETTTDYLQASQAYPGLPATVVDYDNGFLPRSLPSHVGEWAMTPPASSVVLLPNTIETRGYRFSSFYHPYACLFLRELNRSGVDGLLKWSMNEHPIQLTNEGAGLFEAAYQPNSGVTLEPYPVEDVDFSFRGAYSIYNWEIFFHAPFLIATRLMANQRFAEAQRWFHYIFDPTSGGEEKAPRRFWKVRPFYENLDLASIEEELTELAEAWSKSTKTLANLLEGKLGDPGVKALQEQIEASRREPFNPHLIARMRPLAYQKAVFIKYVENLFAWGDQLFRQDTIESINEATQLYILAGSILGKRPRRVRSRTEPPTPSYWGLDADGLDPFSDAIVQAESLGAPGGKKVSKGYFKQSTPDLRLLAFCVPPNDAMLDLWDTVADRLFKIRHSMNLDGVVRQLPLFEPPIDPALLVQATALGVDLATAIADASAAVPHYRFSVMHAKAMEICGSVINLGGAFLSALEKKDAEGLSRLRSGHEIEMLKLVRETKTKQLKDAQNSLVALERSLDVVQTRYDYYRQISPISAAEREALMVSGAASLVGVAAQLVTALAPAAQHVPTITFGTAGTMGSPVTLNAQGGMVEAPALGQEGQALSMAAGLLRDEASVIATLAGYQRRAEDWKLQERLAQKEIVQMQKQIVGAQIRVAIAEADLAHHERQIEQTQEVDAYLRDKFTSEALYDRMVDRLSTVYFESYKLAYDVAKKAEKAFKFELGLAKTSPNMVTFGYWDSLKQGLLAGEQLQFDLRRLEVAYLDQNARELEITKHISLAEIDPVALLMLREKGECEFDVKEELFDADYQKHYLRRIKSVSVTLPAVTGPYSGVSCTLLLKNNRTRKSDALLVPEGYPYSSSKDGASETTRFYFETQPRGPVVTSSAQNDAGLFEVNLRDERYLPFEGAGVIGTWSVKLPKDTNGFDVSTLDDLILHVRYTARVATAEAFLALEKPKPVTRRIFSARAEFPDAWALLMNPLPDEAQTLTFALDRSLFPYVVSTKKIIVTNAMLYARWSGARNFSASSPLTLALNRPGLATPEPRGLTVVAGGQNLVVTPAIVPTGTQRELGDWTIQISSDEVAHLIAELRTRDASDDPRLDETLQDIWLVCDYEAAPLSS
jgi:Tc toxin complex TcA C-terminal TcB-binding domain/Neuraminidase-like domain